MGLFTTLVVVLCAVLAQHAAVVVAQSVRRRGITFCAGSALASQPRRCPCLITAVFSRSLTRGISLLIVPQATFESWRKDFDASKQVGSPRPPIRNTTGQWRPIPLFAATQAGQAVWSPGARRFNETGSFVLVAIARSGCSTGRMVLETRPESCPLRLADRQSVVARNGASTFVVGGTKVETDDEFNGFNALISTVRGNCTGTVISNQWILTAAHCNVFPGSIVRIGGTSLSNGKRYFVETSIRHRNYVGQQSTFGAARIVNDIAVLKLSEVIANPRIIKLNSNPLGPDPGTIVRATGYGLISTTFPSNYLRMVDIPVLSTEECRQRFRSTQKYRVARGLERRHHICSGRDNRCAGGGVCFGDSGGPISARIPDGSLVQVGITSFGDATCANSDSADVFTRVSSYRDWIQGATDGAATFVDWESVNNVASSGSYGTESQGGALPTWAIVSIAVSAGVAVVALVLACFLLIGRRRGREESDSDSEAGDPRPFMVSPSTVQQPPQAVLEQSPQPSAPPPPSPPRSPHRNNSSTSPSQAQPGRGSLGMRPVQ